MVAKPNGTLTHKELHLIGTALGALSHGDDRHRGWLDLIGVYREHHRIETLYDPPVGVEVHPEVDTAYKAFVREYGDPVKQFRRKTD